MALRNLRSREHEKMHVAALIAAVICEGISSGSLKMYRLLCGAGMQSWKCEVVAVLVRRFKFPCLSKCYFVI